MKLHISRGSVGERRLAKSIASKLKKHDRRTLVRRRAERWGERNSRERKKDTGNQRMRPTDIYCRCRTILEIIARIIVTIVIANVTVFLGSVGLWGDQPVHFRENVLPCMCDGSNWNKRDLIPLVNPTLSLTLISFIDFSFHVVCNYMVQKRFLYKARDDKIRL